MMTDLRSTNGVEVQGQRIRGSASLADGDRIRIGGHEFTFEIGAG
jgi:pSer/pThr/pTyr-binding forkhead associated (FHA) protein